MARKKQGGSDNPVLARNRAARHEYHILQTFEAGIVLVGTEVKSAREGKVNLKEAYGRIQGGEVFLMGAHFSPYSHGNIENHEPVRPRKLLLNKAEIRKLAKQADNAGMTLVPLQLYLKNGRIKLELAVARGKKLHDKREDDRKREARREIERESGRYSS